MDESKEAVAPKEEAVESESTQEEVQQTAEEAKQEEVKKELIRQLKLKVDGKEEVMDLPFEVDEEQAQWLATRIQPTRAAQKRFQEVSAERKKIEAALQNLKGNTAGALKTLGIDPHKFAESYMTEYLKEQDMSEEERRVLHAERRIAELEAEKKQREQLELQKQQEAQYQASLQEYSTKITQALEKSNLPKSNATQKKMAEYMMMNIENGIDLPMDSIVEMVKEDYLQDIQEMFGSASGEQLINLFGDDLTSKIRKTDLERLKTAPTASAKPTEVAKADVVSSTSDKEYITPEELEDFINKRK